MKIYTLTLTYNRLPLLQRCVRSIKNSPISPQGIVVVDNSDNSDSYDWCKTQPDVTYVKGDNSLGVIARNLGLQVIPKDDDVVIFQVDDDAIATPNYFQIAEKYFSNPKIGAIGQDAWKLTNYEGFQTEGVSQVGARCHMLTGYLWMWRASLGIQYDGVNFPRFWREESDAQFQVIAKGYHVVKCEPLGGHASHRSTIDWELHNKNTAAFAQKWKGNINLELS